MNLYGFVSNDPLDHIDTLGQYQLDVHFYATYMVAIANGRSAADAYTLAYYAQYPDQDRAYDAIPAAVRNIWRKLFGQEKSNYDFALEELLHSLHGGTPAQAKAWRECLSDMVRSEPDGWQKGFMVHALGDAYSHTKGNLGEGSGYVAPEGHLEDGTDPDIPQLRPELLRQYLGALNASLGGSQSVDLDAIASQLTKAPVQRLLQSRSPKAGGNVYESESAARYRQARAASGYTGAFDPAGKYLFKKNNLDSKMGKPIDRGDVDSLLKRIRQHCGCTIGK